MANETMQHLADLSKKSVQNVESIYNQTMEQLKKTSPIYKQYETSKDNNMKNKKYAEFMTSFMVELKKKLGINKDLAVESVIRESDESDEPEKFDAISLISDMLKTRPSNYASAEFGGNTVWHISGDTGYVGYFLLISDNYELELIKRTLVDEEDYDDEILFFADIDDKEEVENLVRKAIRLNYNIKESIIKESGEEMVSVWGIFTWKNRDGSIDDELSESQKNDFEEAFGGEFGEVPEEIDSDGFDAAYLMTRTQYEWCEKNYSELFPLAPEEDIIEDVAAVTTSSMGSPTTATGEKAPHGSSAIFAQRMGMTSRAGNIGKKKKKIRESEAYINTQMLVESIKKDELGFFWVVTYPTGDSELMDILFQADIERMRLQFLGGLTIEEIYGVFPDEMSATNNALKLLRHQKDGK